MAPGFRLEGVARSWGGRDALRDIDLVIEPGERIALAGPSGSGKTTLLRLMAGALKPTSGRILVDGTDLSSLGPRALRRHRARCGFVSQGQILIPGLSVHANVLCGRLASWRWWWTLGALLWPVERERTRALLEAVGLADRQWDEAVTLSGGQQQRVVIARALASDPDAILADEPTASLDPTTAEEVAKLLMARAEDRGVTMLFCTHWLTLVTGHADRIVGLRGGRIVLDAPAREVGTADLDALYAGSRELR